MNKDTQCRKWLLTINNPKEHGFEHCKIKDVLSGLKSVVYWCMADEIGLEDQTYHTHLFIYGKSGIRFSTLKKVFPMAHMDMAKGTCKQNMEYVTKSGKWLNDKKNDTRVDGTFEEFGELPAERQGARNDLEDLYDMIKQGMSNYEILEQGSGYMLSLESIDRTRQIIIQEKYKNTWRDLDVTYIYGDTGVGKTRGVMEKYGYENVYRVTDYLHPFDNYAGQDVILFDEFCSSLPLTTMNKCLEGYPLELPCRYANKYACYTKVYVIANVPLSFHYQDIYNKSEQLWLSFIRRFKKVLHYMDGRIEESHIEISPNGFRTVLDGENPNPYLVFNGSESVTSGS